MLTINRFYILDCNGKIVGNKSGYATIRGAIRQQNQKGSPAYKAIWAAFYAAKAIDPNWEKLAKIVQYKPQEHTARGIFGYRFIEC